jgi:hypothetical protein
MRIFIILLLNTQARTHRHAHTGNHTQARTHRHAHTGMHTHAGTHTQAQSHETLIERTHNNNYSGTKAEPLVLQSV